MATISFRDRILSVDDSGAQPMAVSGPQGILSGSWSFCMEGSQDVRLRFCCAFFCLTKVPVDSAIRWGTGEFSSWLVPAARFWVFRLSRNTTIRIAIPAMSVAMPAMCIHVSGDVNRVRLERVIINDAGCLDVL